MEGLAECDSDPEGDHDEQRQEDAAAPVPPAAKALAARAHGVKSTAPRA
jgi:hypothetical protein